MKYLANCQKAKARVKIAEDTSNLLTYADNQSKIRNKKMCKLN